MVCVNGAVTKCDFMEYGLRCQSGTSKAEFRERIVKSQFAISPKSNFYSGQEEVRRKPVVYTVAAGEMQKTGYVFYRSINGV